MLAVKSLSHNGPELSPLATIELVISLASGVVSKMDSPREKVSSPMLDHGHRHNQRVADVAFVTIHIVS
jgi:hypothetical protein